MAVPVRERTPGRHVLLVTRKSLDGLRGGRRSLSIQRASQRS
jgi:hypothetical protein